MELIDLVEAAIVADLKLDTELAAYLPREHDADRMKGGDDQDNPNINERPYAITVTAEERGDFKGAPGSGIKLVGVSVEIMINEGGIADGPSAGAQLGRLAEKVNDRLPATQQAELSRHRAFCTARLLVMGIMANERETRTDADLTRARVVTREFIAIQIA